MNSAGQASQTVGQGSQTVSVLHQIAAVMGLELKKTFLSRRGWWVYVLALAPVGLALLHSVSMGHIRWRGHNAGQDAKIFAAMFQTYFLHLGIFFGCVGIFTNLFRAEMLEKTLHYYFLTPIRREWLVTGKYLTGLLVAAVLFPASAGLSMYFMGRHQGAAWSDFLMHGPGLAQLLAYMMIALLASIGYGAVFLTAGLFFRNPMIPAATSVQAFTTEAIVTHHSGPISVPPNGVHETYQFIPMKGQASFVFDVFEAMMAGAPKVGKSTA